MIAITQSDALIDQGQFNGFSPDGGLRLHTTSERAVAEGGGRGGAITALSILQEHGDRSACALTLAYSCDLTSSAHRCARAQHVLRAKIKRVPRHG
jgi:hypothetical protein